MAPNTSKMAVVEADVGQDANTSVGVSVSTQTGDCQDCVPCAAAAAPFSVKKSPDSTEKSEKAEEVKEKEESEKAEEKVREKLDVEEKEQEEEDENPAPSFKCKICGKSFPQKFLFRRHAIRKHGAGAAAAAHRCAYCGAGFFFASLKDKHELNVHKNRCRG
jgi:hypothetical protein